jgi:hypothetical protein
LAKNDTALKAHRAAPHFLQYAKKDRAEEHLYEPLA